MVENFYSYKNFCGLIPLKFIKLNKEVFNMFIDARLEKLENLYDKYDSAITKKEKRLVLNEILEYIQLTLILCIVWLICFQKSNNLTHF